MPSIENKESWSSMVNITCLKGNRGVQQVYFISAYTSIHFLNNRKQERLYKSFSGFALSGVDNLGWRWAGLIPVSISFFHFFISWTRVRVKFNRCWTAGLFSLSFLLAPSRYLVHLSVRTISITMSSSISQPASSQACVASVSVRTDTHTHAHRPNGQGEEEDLVLLLQLHTSFSSSSLWFTDLFLPLFSSSFSLTLTISQKKVEREREGRVKYFRMPWLESGFCA